MLESIGVVAAVSICCLLSLFFVLSLYFVDLGKSRNHPDTVRRRIYAILVVCVLAPSALYVLVRSQLGFISIASFASELGLRWNGLLAAICIPTLLIFVLYAGPIFQSWMDGVPLVSWTVPTWRKDFALRNYVVGPFSEELIFRACMLSLLTPAIGEVYGVLLCPLLFGVAHLHHLMEWYRANDGTPFVDACLPIFVQFCYTSVFGLFEGFLFVRTRHLTANVLCHSLCNVMGLPPVDRALDHSRRYLILSVYLVGLISFFSLLLPLTNPSLYAN